LWNGIEMQVINFHSESCSMVVISMRKKTNRKTALRSRVTTLWLHMVDPEMHAKTEEAFREGNVLRMLCTMDNMRAIEFVEANISALQIAGIYEQCLVGAYIGTRTSLHGESLCSLRALFRLADRAALLLAGDPVPAGTSFVLHRGIAGRGRQRRTHGLSWTGSIEVARWFARRAGEHLPDPAVVTAVVPRESIFFYSNEREEDEYVLDIPTTAVIKRIERIAPAHCTGS
jgi:hypothetical protein